MSFEKTFHQRPT